MHLKFNPPPTTHAQAQRARAKVPAQLDNKMPMQRDEEKSTLGAALGWGGEGAA